MNPGKAESLKRKAQNDTICEKKLKLSISNENHNEKIGNKRAYKHSMTILQKVNLLDDWNDKSIKWTKAALAEKYKICESGVRYIIKSEDRIRKAYIEMDNKTAEIRKRTTLSKFIELDRVLILWFLQQRDKGIPISGEIITNQALLFHSRMKEKQIDLWKLDYFREKSKIFKEELTIEQYGLIHQEVKEQEIEKEWENINVLESMKVKNNYIERLAKIEHPFKASNGFLRNFKNRYGIRELAIQGEQLSSDNNCIEEFINMLQHLIKTEQYSSDQIYNSDESGLYWKALPTKTLASSREKRANGFKMNKERITLNFCANASGKDRLPLLVIGKSKNPRSIKDCKNNLPVWYKSSSSAWMTSEIFGQWLHEYFVPHVLANLKAQNLPLKALLIVDNAAVHQYNIETNKIDLKVLFLPPNTTSLIQPMDQGVISAFKRNYKFRFMRGILAKSGFNSDNLIEDVNRYSLKECIYAANDTWKELSDVTLINSWNKIGVNFLNFKNALIEENNSELCTFSNSEFELLNLEEKDFEEINNLDKNDKGYAYMTDNEIIDYVLESSCKGNQCEKAEEILDEEEYEEKKEELITSTKISHTKALGSICRLINYTQENIFFKEEAVNFLKKMRIMIETSRIQELQQAEITKFFS